MTDWYLCFKSDISTVNCLGPFKDAFEAHTSVSKTKDNTVIGVCRYMPEFMSKETIINRYNKYNNTPFTNEFVFKTVIIPATCF